VRLLATRHCDPLGYRASSSSDATPIIGVNFHINTKAGTAMWMQTWSIKIDIHHCQLPLVNPKRKKQCEYLTRPCRGGMGLAGFGHLYGARILSSGTERELLNYSALQWNFAIPTVDRPRGHPQGGNSWRTNHHMEDTIINNTPNPSFRKALH
jgi:hypothetical protein